MTAVRQATEFETKLQQKLAVRCGTKLPRHVMRRKPTFRQGYNTSIVVLSLIFAYFQITLGETVQGLLPTRRPRGIFRHYSGWQSVYLPQFPRFLDIRQVKAVYQNKQEVRSVVWSAVGSTSVAHTNCILTRCGRVTQICVFNTVKLGTSESSPQCHSTRGKVSRGIIPSSTTRVFGEYFLKISVHKSSQRICYKFLKKHSIKVD